MAKLRSTPHDPALLTHQRKTAALRSRAGALALALVATLAGGAATPAAIAAEPAGPADPARRAWLLALVRQDCGSCHGLTLRGGLGPALTAQALRDTPSENLVAVVLFGRPGTAMPPWRAFLDEAEARWVVETLKKGMPDGR